jgi:hypothetical protein
MANNVFPYATYEGTVDTDKIADPVSSSHSTFFIISVTI